MSIVIDRLSYSMLLSLLTFNCGFGGDLIAVELSPRFDLPRQLNGGFCGVEYGISPNIFLDRNIENIMDSLIDCM